MTMKFDYGLVSEVDTIPLWERPDGYTEIKGSSWQFVLASHSTECNVVQMVEHDREYLTQCSNACQRCCGTGKLVFGVQRSVGDEMEAVYDHCPSCIYEDRCPRCAGPVLIITGVAGDYFVCVGETAPFRIGQKYPVARVRGCGWTDSPGCLTPEYAFVAKLDCSCDERRRSGG